MAARRSPPCRCLLELAPHQLALRGDVVTFFGSCVSVAVADVGVPFTAESLAVPGPLRRAMSAALALVARCAGPPPPAGGPRSAPRSPPARSASPAARSPDRLMSWVLSGGVHAADRASAGSSTMATMVSPADQLRQHPAHPADHRVQCQPHRVLDQITRRLTRAPWRCAVITYCLPSSSSSVPRITRMVPAVAAVPITIHRDPQVADQVEQLGHAPGLLLHAGRIEASDAEPEET